MKKTKLAVSLLAVFVFSFCLLAGSFDTAQAKSKKIKLRMAGQYSTDHASSVSMRKIAKLVNERSNGRIEIKTYPNSMLGDWVLVYEEMIRGTIDMALISVPSQFDSRLELPYIHYLMKDYADVRNVFKANGWLYNKMDALHNNLGVKFLGFHVEGFGGLGMTKEITEPLNPGTNKDVLLRVCSIDAFKQWADDCGYSTVTIPLAELYTALQTGVADGWSGGGPVHSYKMFRDVLKHFYQLNYFVENESIMMSQKIWNKLSAEDQKLIAEVCAEVAADSINISEKEDGIYLQKLRDQGIQVHTYTSEEIQPLVDHCRKVTWPLMEKRMTPELMHEVEEQFAK